MNIVDSLLRVALLGSSWVLWLLLALSVVSIAAMVERWAFFRKNRAGGEALRDELSRALIDDDDELVEAVLTKNPSVEATVLREALRWKKGGPDAFADAVESELGRARAKLDRSMTLLGTLGNNAPFIGLFGTVLGVIEAFQHLSSGAGEAAMGSVMSGIAEALVATGVGIFVAIPAVVAYNVAQKKVDDVEGDTHALAKLITAWLRTGAAPRRDDARAISSDREAETSLALAGAE